MSEAPDRIWLWGDIYCSASRPGPHRDAAEYIRKDAVCVEVKEGYSVHVFNTARHDCPAVPLSEALTIRSVEDVRAEVFAEIKAYETQFDTPAPSREDCPECKGSGMRDSGGVYPWGEHIEVPCDCNEPQPAPTPEPVAWMIRDELGVRLFKNIDSANRVARLGGHVVQALYASPSTPASHAEELRKAKAEAWDEGYQWAYDGMSQRNPYRRSTDEGASHE